MSALAIVPTFVRKQEELEVTVRTLETIKSQEPELETLVVDDRSPAQELIPELEQACERLNVRLHQKDENTGFARSVNVGLREALDRGLAGILINADMELLTPFVKTFEETVDSENRPAAVVGGLLLYPNGLIQFGGTFLSFYSRGFDHKFRYAPGGLPEANVPAVTPITGALQYIRHSTLETVGIYDWQFSMAYEDVDFSLRTFEAGLECVYNPRVRAIHHESLFRGQGGEKLDEWHQQSLARLHEKHGSTSLGRYVLPIA